MRNVLGLSLVLVGWLVSAVAVAAELSVSDPWIREAPPNARALGAFMTLSNSTDQAQTLVAARSAAAERVEIHRTVMERGMANMVMQPAVEIPAKGSVTMAPGGLHIMLIGPKQALKAGDQVEIVLELKSGAKIPVMAVVRKGDAMPMPMDHGHGHGGHGMMH